MKKTYQVTGAAFVSVQIEVFVQADDPEIAMEMAMGEFKRRRGELVVPQSEDLGFPFDFKPSAAEEYEPGNLP